MTNLQTISMNRYLAMQLLAEAAEQPEQEVFGFVQVAADNSTRAEKYGLLNSLAEFDKQQHDWLFWQLPEHSPELTSDDLDYLPVAELYLLISLNIKGVLEMKAWTLDEAQQLVEIPIQVHD